MLRLEHSLIPFVQKLQDAGSRVSLFIDPDMAQIKAAARTQARVIELHTGAYAEGKLEVSSIHASAHYAASLGLEVHAGHGLNYENTGPIAAIEPIVELNIGHFLMGEAIFVGLTQSIATMRRVMNEARA